MNSLNGFNMDHWYKVLIGASFTVFCLALVQPLQTLPNLPVQLISLGSFFFGLGEWRNHPLQTTVYPTGVTTGYPRRWTVIGGLFDALGLIGIGYGIWLFWR